MISIDYEVPRRGLGTDFSKSERPISYAEAFKNRFINVTGGAERRNGMSQLGSTITGSPNLTRLHEYVDNDGNETLFATSDNAIFKYNASAATWSQVRSGLSSSRLLSVQFGNKLIFCNGIDRNFYTDDSGATFKELKAIISRGETNSGSNTTTLRDVEVSAWLTQTNIAVNDLVFNVTLSAYGVITAVSGAEVTHTTIGSAATGAGVATNNQGSGQRYEIIDGVDLNIIPQSDGTLDNVAIATSGTSTTVIAVSGVNFANTEIKVGDFVRNTTRNSVAIVQAVSANINVNSTTAQTSGDSLIFIKSGMPIASFIHVNFGRLAFIDARNKKRVVFTAPDDPEDVTTFAKTLDSSSFQFGNLQPLGDSLLAIGSFQNYFVAMGSRYVFVYTGITPIQDTNSTTKAFAPIAYYPNGGVSRFGLSSNGNDLLYVSKDGLQGINVGADSNNTIQNNVSFVIRSQIRDAIKNQNPDDIQITFYPRRSWVLVKVGDTIYNFNNSPILNEQGALEANGSWSVFDGLYSQLNHYFVRRNGDLIACGANGRVYNLDESNQFTDAGQVITTELKTAWLRIEDPERSVRVKDGRYLKPIFESGGGLSYTINAVAGWDSFSADSIQVIASGSSLVGSAIVGDATVGGSVGVQTQKVPLRWRGEEVQLTFTTATSAGPDVITGFSIYGNIFGRR